jgi:serine/threonine-protein kinase
MAALADKQGLVVGRYVVYDEIAAGGMATVHLGRLMGAVGFARTVAIKRLLAHHARDEDFTAMFLDEARLAARIRHPNVVAVLDVLHESGELFLVMDYVQGESFSRLVRAVRPGVIPARIAVSVVTGVLHGLHAAHEATTEHGEPLHIVHRDVSPQNIMVGTDGVARVLDFGVAKAAHRAQTTRDGALKGKISYMAPEQLLSEHVDRRADIYAAAVVLWEALTGERLFDGDNQGRVVRKILDEPVPRPSTRVPGLPKALEDAVMRGIERDILKRFQTAREFATALERSMHGATSTEVGEWVEAIGGSTLGERLKRVKEIESRSDIYTGPISAERPTHSSPPTEIEKRPEEPKRLPPMNPTVPQAFAVMAHAPSDPPIPDVDVKFSSAPPPPDEPVPDVRIPKPTPALGRPNVVVPSPFAPMPVQTLSVRLTPLAQLDPVPVPLPLRTESADEPGAQPSESLPPPAPRRWLAFVIVIIVCALAGGSLTWLRLHGKL